MITKEVEVGLSGNNLRYFEELGYEIPKYYNKNNYRTMVKKGTKIKVKVEDLTHGSNILVDIQCDGCEEILKNITWQNYKKGVREDGKYYCHKCASNLYGKEKELKSRLKNGKSFYQWCYENLTKEEADKIMTHWDYDLNIDKNGNILDPKNISFRSNGLNKKGYWFKCLDYPEHKSELKNISSFIGRGKGSVNCFQCNTISITHPELVKYLVNKEDAYKYSIGSSKVKILVKCPDCGYEKKMSVNTLSNQGFGCNKCSDGVSYPQKFMFAFLEQFNLNFETELSKTIFTWCNNYRFDFYINEINCVIETHGIQHYKENKNWSMILNEIIENDKRKEDLARENGIQNYIIIDCRKSEIEWIKNNIMYSELPHLLNFKEEDIDWLKCHKCACSSLVKEVCGLWDSGIHNTNKIGEKLKIDRSTVIIYLKRGAKLKWCDYNPKEEIKHKESLNKQVICLTTGEIFNSIKEAKNKYNINDSNISQCCRNNYKYAGVHPITGEKLVWMYYDEYIKIKI